ncbi:MAG TPA: peptidoglycan-binding domain-containing protein [Gemmatimonadaceae bacterium]
MDTRRTVAMLAAVLLMPAAAFAQQDTTRRDTTRADRPRVERDTTRNRMDAQGRRNVPEQGRVSAESRGSVAAGARARRNLGLTSTQVTMLQQALKDGGCDPGPVDGVVGPRTRRAIACGFRTNDLDGRNLNELFRSLDLQLTVEDSLGVDAVMRGDASARARTGRETDADRNRALDRDTGAARDTSANRERPRQRETGRADTVHRNSARDTSQTTERPPRR